MAEATSQEARTRFAGQAQGVASLTRPGFGSICAPADNSENIKSVLVEHIAPGQTIRSDGYPAYNVAKKANFFHDKQIIYPKNGTPRYDVLKWVNILVRMPRRLYSELTMAFKRSTFSVTLMNSVIGSIGVSGQGKALIVSYWRARGRKR